MTVLHSAPATAYSKRSQGVQEFRFGDEASNRTLVLPANEFDIGKPSAARCWGFSANLSEGL